MVGLVCCAQRLGGSTKSLLPKKYLEKSVKGRVITHLGTYKYYVKNAFIQNITNMAS